MKIFVEKSKQTLARKIEGSSMAMTCEINQKNCDANLGCKLIKICKSKFERNWKSLRNCDWKTLRFKFKFKSSEIHKIFNQSLKIILAKNSRNFQSKFKKFQ